MTRSIGAYGEIGFDPTEERIGEMPPGPYRALVTNVDDPDKLGRIQAFVYALMQGPPTDRTQWTGWIAPRHPVNGFSVPALHSLVWVEFEQGTFDYPTYSGHYHRADKKPPALALGEDDGNSGSTVTHGGVLVPAAQSGSSTYPKNHVFVTPAGLTVEFDDTGGGRIRVAHPTGTFIELRSDGAVTVNANGDVKIGASGNVLIAGDDVSIGTDGAASLKCGGITATNGVMMGPPTILALQAAFTAINTFASALGAGPALNPVLAGAAATAAATLAGALSAITFSGTVTTKTVAE